MRKLCLTLAAGAALLATGSLSQPASAMTPAAGLRAAIADTSAVDQVAWVCTHFWNGRWHHRQNCFWSGGHYRHHYRHHHHRRHHW